MGTSLRTGLLLLTAAAVALLGVATAHADTVLDFEGLTAADQVSFGDAGATNYGGLLWDGDDWWLESEADYQSDWYDFNQTSFASGEYAAFNGFGLTVETVANTPMIFVGAYFLGWAEADQAIGYTSTSITIHGYLDGNFVGTVSSDIAPDSMDWVGANLGPVDKLLFMPSSQETWWLMDDFTFRAVPEPSSLSLLGLGVGVFGMSYVRRRRAGRAS